MWEYIVNALRDVLTWFMGIFSDICSWILAKVMALIPASAKPSLTFLQPYYDAANAWFPVDLALTLLGAYGSLVMCVIAFRWIKSIIPTLGN